MKDTLTLLVGCQRKKKSSLRGLTDALPEILYGLGVESHK